MDKQRGVRRGWKSGAVLGIKWQIGSKINVFWKLSSLSCLNVDFWTSLPLGCQLVSPGLLVVPGLYLWSDVVLTCPWYVCSGMVSWPAAPICWILCDHYFVVLLQLYTNVFIFSLLLPLACIILNLIEMNHLGFAHPFTKPGLSLKHPVFVQQDGGIFFKCFSLGYTGSTPCLWE